MGNGDLAVWGYSQDTGYSSFSYNTDYTFKMVKENNSIKIYSNETLLKTVTNIGLLSVQNINIGLRNWGSGTGTAKNIKIKPL